MRFVAKLGLGLSALLTLAAASLAAWEPLTAERMAAPAARAYDVRILRDDFGVPHIYGRDDPSVGYGLAYAHAEDDFATLQEVIAATRGRLGAMTGADGAKTDFALHLIGARATVAATYDRLAPDTRALLDAYAAGLNRYADKHPDEVRLSKLFPVNGRDVAAGFVLRSPFFFGLDAVLGKLVEGAPLPIERGPALDAPNVTPTGPQDEKGSNAWAVAPKRTVEGLTHLVSNSHQPYKGGVAWYEVRVKSDTGWDYAGALFPGAPMPLLGHNRTLGWTNTVNRPDLIDVYRLVLDEAGERYRFDGQWRPLERTRVWLPVRFGPFVLPVPRTIDRSVHGPVIRNDDGAFAIRYAGIGDGRAVEQYYRLTRARSFEEWQQVMRMRAIPATNFIYADARGNIAFLYNGLFPERSSGFDWTGILPGDTSRALWTSYVPFERLPMLVNPPSGYVTNANNTPFEATSEADDLRPEAFAPEMGIETDMTNRAQRAIELMDADPQLTRAELEALKYDNAYSRVGYPGRWMAAIAALDLSGDAGLAEAQRLLAGWDWTLDGRGPADALAALVLKPANRTSYRREGLPDAREELAAAASHLRTHFGRLDPPLGALLRLRHGKVDLPLAGGPDALRAAANWDVAEDGRAVVKHGDSFVMFVEWDRAGRVASRSVQPFGSATTRPDSKHYADQAPLFARQQLKPVHLEEADLRRHLTREYRP